jgi:hypothetical protein
MSAPEFDDIWRVYRPQWLVARLIRGDEESPDELMAQAQRYADEHYRGRVHEHDLAFEVTHPGLIRIKWRLPTLVAEWKTRELAARYAADHGFTDATIVTRNSREDFELRAYGVRQLPEDAT